MTGLFLHSSHETIHNSYQLHKTSNSSLQIRLSTQRWSLLKTSRHEKLTNWQAPQIQMHDHFSLQDNFKDSSYNHQSYMNFLTHNFPPKTAPPPYKRIFLSNKKTFKSTSPLQHTHLALSLTLLPQKIRYGANAHSKRTISGTPTKKSLPCTVI